MDLVRQVERNPAVALSEQFDANPYDLARCHQRVELRGFVVVHPGWQHFRFENRCGDGNALQLFDGVQQRFRSSAAGRDALPGHQESSERIGLDWFDLAAEAGERAAPDHVQHVRVDPLTVRSAGAEFSMDDPPVSARLAAGACLCLRRRVHTVPRTQRL